jgi:demethoxyubiquinone hydroxylase (CLK1/Coq7/Cat5 family)
MFQSLQQFLGAYFHQDCFDDSTDADAVVQDYLRNSSVHEVKITLNEVRQLLRQEKDEPALASALLGLGSFYLPAADGLTSKQWLERLTAAFEARVQTS